MQILTGHNNARRAAHEAARVRNYELAGLISFAHHDPKKMPKYTAIGAQEKKASDEADQARARGLLIAMALRSEKQRG